MRRHHPERFLGGENPVSPPGDSDLDRPDDAESDLPGLCAYDAVVGRPVTYQDAVQREKAIAAELENEQLREAAEIRRKNLFTREQVEARDESIDTIVLSHFEQLVGFVGTLVPPEQGAALRDKAMAWVAGVKDRIGDAIAAADL